MAPSSRSEKPAKKTPHPYATEAFLADLRRQGVLPVLDGGRVSIRLPASIATLEMQSRIGSNGASISALLRGLRTCLSLGLPEERWWRHLERVSKNGVKPRKTKTADQSDQRPHLPDTLDSPPDLETLPPDQVIAVDTETYCPPAVLSAWGKKAVPLPWIPESELVCVGFAVCSRRFAYPAENREAIVPWLSTPNPKVFFTLYDLVWLIAADFEVAGLVHDARWVRTFRDGVRAGALKKTGAYRYAVHLPYLTPDLAKTFVYCGNDAMATITGFENDEETQTSRLYRLYQSLALPLARMSLVGLPIFERAWEAELARTEAHRQDLEARLTDIAPIDWRSRKDLLTIPDLAGVGFFSAKTGAPSFNSDSLLASDHPAAPPLRDLRVTDTLLNTYLRPRLGRPRMHGLFVLAGAWTGRTSSHNVNLQNFPKSLRHLLGQDGFDWVVMDLSNAELVVASVLANCETLLSVFAAGGDPHRETAARFFNKPITAVTDEERARGKITNFALLYGGSWRTLRRNAREAGFSMSREEAESFVEMWFSAYPEFEHYHRHLQRLQADGQWVVSPFGRRWYARSRDLGQLINAPISSASSDLLLLGLDAVYPKLCALGQPVAVVHDEIDVITASGFFDVDAWRDIARTMAGIDPRFPLRVNVAVGSSWGTVEKRLSVSAHD
jgi:hypothetical protein